jgi:hypothetical protein
MSARKSSPGPPPARAWGIADPALLAGVWVPQSPCLLLGLQCSLSRSVGGEAWPSCVRVPLRPVCHIPCRGHVLHGTRLNEALAMTMPAVPSCVPVSAPQQASACARALSTVSSCQPHGNSSQPCAPVFAAAGLSLLPAWCAARLAGGQPGGLTSSQHWHAGAAERHAPWGHGRGARRCWRVGHVKSGLFSLYSPRDTSPQSRGRGLRRAPGCARRRR